MFPTSRPLAAGCMAATRLWTGGTQPTLWWTSPGASRSPWTCWRVRWRRTRWPGTSCLNESSKSTTGTASSAAPSGWAERLILHWHSVTSSPPSGGDDLVRPLRCFQTQIFSAFRPLFPQTELLDCRFKLTLFLISPANGELSAGPSAAEMDDVHFGFIFLMLKQCSPLIT